MKSVSTYIASGWDFAGESNNGSDDVWVEDIDGSVNNGYPYLAMQNNTPVFSGTYVDVNPINDVLVNSNSAFVVNVSSTNNNGGNTLFTATSSDETIATVAISNSSTIGNQTNADLTITNLNEGIINISVYGSNPNNIDGGASVFSYEADYTGPTANLDLKVNNNNVSTISINDVLTITANFSESLSDSPIVQLQSTVFSPTDMTKVTDSQYTYTWNVPDDTASGDITFSLLTGTDLSGNTVISSPLSGSSILLEQHPVLPVGSGTESDPYQISSFDNLLWLSANGGSSQHFLQTADIDAANSTTLDSGLGFQPISFNASFYNGAGYKISNLFMDRPTTASGGYQSGLFGLVKNGSIIRNVSVVDANIKGYQLVGVLIGALQSSSALLTSYATGVLESDGRQSGALVGNLSGGTIKNCYSDVTLSRFGGSYTLGTISGNNYGNDLIENCYSIGGGTTIIAISHYTSGNAAVKNCFYLDTHTYTGSNWCNSCVESSEAPKSEVEMKTVSTYTASGWDFAGESNNGSDNVWMIDNTGVINDGYPYFNPDIYLPPDTTLPVITSTATASIDENVVANTTVYTVTATDNIAVTGYAIAGVDAASFTIDQISGVVSINASPDFETQSSYSFDVMASDEAGNNSNSTSVTLSINNLPDTSIQITADITQSTNIIANVEITNTGSLTLNNNAGIDGDVTLTGGAELTLVGTGAINGDVTISTGGSLIASAGSISGILTYTRNIPTTNWYLIYSPVIGQDIDAFVSASNLAAGTGSNIAFADYNNNTESWSYYQNGATGTGDFVTGQGHSIKLNAIGDVVFTGAFNDTDESIALTSNTNGFNLIGNPYLASVSVSELLAETNNSSFLSEQTVWLWDQAQDTYVQKNFAQDLEVAPGQAFFVSVVSSGNFTIKETMQSHSTDSFQRTTATRPEINLMLTNGTNTTDTDIFYIEGTTTGWDNGYDSSMFGGTANSFAIYTHLVSDSEGQNLGIQSLPDTGFESMIVPVGINAVSGTTITISAATQNLPEGIDVYLEDREESSFALLETGENYITTLSETLNGIGRYYLHTSAQVLSTDDLIAANMSLYMTNSKTLRVVGVQSGTAQVKVYSMLGKQVYTASFLGNGMNEILLPKIAKGVYLIQLETRAGMSNKKVIIE